MPCSFLTLALTGGIATGKSSFVKLLQETLPDLTSFDCDTAVHELLTDPSIAGMIGSILGLELLDPAGKLIKSRLQERIFRDANAKKALEEILHPSVRERCQLTYQQAKQTPGIRFFLMEVPLLYESDFPEPRDLDVVVACGPLTQRARLFARSRLTPALADRIIASQLPLKEKLARAQVVIWNGGSPSALRRHTSIFSTWLKSKLTT